ncbi:sensor histidine kinase [Clostridium sp.]|uniref:sensor histidine kinase n=1 Tax=Clostridium sp. TaxID=1506 RepID=UPI003F348B39
MSWKNKWNSIGIKKKIFVSSGIIMTASFMILYMCIYIFMPRVYNGYIVKKINNNVKVLEKTLSEEESIDLIDVLDKFSYDNNVQLILFDKEENNDVKNIIYTSFKGGMKNPSKIPFLHNDNGMFNVRVGGEYDDPFQAPVINNSKRENLNIRKSVFIKVLGNEYNMAVHVPVSPIEQITTVVELFFPFAIVAIIIISIIISIFYSRLISKPLISINDVAKKMANLDFENKLEVKGDDEVGQLSSSLNLMNKNLKESFERMEAEIERERALEKERREFIATISHELKSPITIISGQLEGMIYNIGKYKDRDKYLKESYDVTQNMRELVQEILYLSERENVDYKYNFTKVNLSLLSRNVINRLSYFIEEKNMALETYIEDDIFIMGEEKLLRKVITNIIKNAITHSPKEERIIVTLTNSKLTVENTGVIIAERDKDEIFNAFYRVDKSRNRKTGGSGLGLYIVKSILDKHSNIEYNIKSKDNSVIFIMKFTEKLL